MGKMQIVKNVLRCTRKIFNTSSSHTQAVPANSKKLLNASSVHPQTVSADSKELFPFARRHKLKTSQGLSEDGMMLTHLTDYLPNNGFIESAKSGAGQARNSVHFAVNHGVESHALGNWDRKKYAILIPMREARAVTDNKFVGGIAVDFYSKGNVKIPKGSIIVRRTKNVPEGKYIISEASKIEEFKNLHGVKIIDTNTQNLPSEVNNILKRLGYKVKTGDFSTWGKSYRYFNLFNSYLKANGMKPMIHTYTPNGKSETLMSFINYRAKQANNWVVKDKNGNPIIDYKKEILNVLEYIENFAKRTGFPKDLDTKKAAEIIHSSSTPQEAIKLINSKLKIESYPSTCLNITELQYWQGFRQLIGGNELGEITDNLVLNYLKHANKSSFQKLSNAPIGIDTIPDTTLQQLSIYRSKIAQIREQHQLLKIDNSIANKLAELG